MGVGDTVLVVFYGLIFILGIIGNSLIFVFFGFRMKGLATYRLFLIHLAIADCTCSVVTPIVYMYETVSPRWQLGTASCKILQVIPSVSITVSGWILCGIAYERYRAIIHPLKRRLSSRAIHAYCGLLWLLASIVFTPHILKLGMRGGNCRLTFENAQEALVTTIFHFSVQNLLPLLAMFYFFYHMYRASRSHNRLPVQTLLMTVVAFAICSIPQALFYLTVLSIHLYYTDYDNPRLYVKIYTWLLVMLYSNCVVNCVIYAGKFEQFRNFITRLLFLAGGRRHKKQESIECFDSSLQKSRLL